MRLTAQMVEDRVAFLRKVFTKDPTISVRHAQRLLQEQFATDLPVMENRVVRAVPFKGTMRNAAILAVRRECLTAAKKTGTPKA